VLVGLTREVGALVAVAVAVFVLGYAVLDSLLKLLVVVLVLRVNTVIWRMRPDFGE
jgi:hypothetical protein